MVQLPNIYTFGNIKYDAEPLMKTFASIQERRRQLNVAFDKYLENQAKNVDLTKVRPQDQEAFQDMFNDLKRVGIENKKAINSDPTTRLAYENEWKKLSRFASTSIEQEKKKEPFLSRMATRQGREEYNLPRLTEAVASHDSPMFVKDQSGVWVENPNRKTIDVMQDYFDPAPVDFTKEFNKWSANSKKVEIAGTTIPNDLKTPEGKNRYGRYKIMQNIQVGFVPDDVKNIATNAYNDVKSNESLNGFYDREYNNIKNSDEFIALNEILKKYFPNEQIKDAPSLAKALAIKAAEESVTKYTKEVDDDVRLEQRRQSERAQDKAARKSEDGGPGVNVYDAIDIGLPNANYSGEITLSQDKTPAKLLLAMKGLGYDQGFDGVKFNVKNGQIVSVAPSGWAGVGKPTAPISREEILIGQQRAGAKINWGNKQQNSKKKSASSIN